MHALFREPCYIVPCTCGSKWRHSIGIIPTVPSRYWHDTTEHMQTADARCLAKAAPI